MPFKSKAQRRYMHSQHPDIASRWEHEYPTPARLPARKASKRSASKRSSQRKMTRC